MDRAGEPWRTEMGQGLNTAAQVVADELGISMQNDCTDGYQ
jgi:xanthine dehydrogenase molybdopterin-binding subunit B